MYVVYSFFVRYLYYVVYYAVDSSSVCTGWVHGVILGLVARQAKLSLDR